MALPNERTGISLAGFLKATMAGGLLFLLPVPTLWASTDLTLP
jgi:hypothetical protein